MDPGAGAFPRFFRLCFAMAVAFIKLYFAAAEGDEKRHEGFSRRTSGTLTTFAPESSQLRGLERA
jgi:hypothetical protein